MRSAVNAARLLSFLLTLSLVAILAFWAMKLLAPTPAIAPAGSVGDNASGSSVSLASTLFGVAGPVQAVAPPPSNIQVVGVLESGPNGVVIVSVDGKPGQPYVVGASIDDVTRVESVTADKVVLEQRGRKVELKSPERASIAVLSSGVGKARDPARAIEAGRSAAQRLAPNAAVAPAPSALPAQPGPVGIPPAMPQAVNPPDGGQAGQPPAGTVQPGIVQPGIAQPGAVQPGAVQPGMAPQGSLPGAMPNLSPGNPGAPSAGLPSVTRRE